MSDQPNLVLILTDHFRGDCLGHLGHPDAETPHLDGLAAEGYSFRNGYTPCPSCVPARRSLMTGQTPYTQGFTGYKDFEPWEYPHTMAEELRNAGYQTVNVGKTHFYPRRAHLGYEQLLTSDDYEDWLKQQPNIPTEGKPHGVLNNSWMARPHPFPELYMEETWFTSKAIEFLEKRDPTRPFFLTLSFNGPHPPWTPPRDYWDLFINREFQPPAIGDWAHKHKEEARYPLDVNAWRGQVTDSQMHRGRAAYFAYLNYLDAQVGRFLFHLSQHADFQNTGILFTADHGEMLGDHHLWRKTYAYEASAGVPYIMKPPKSHQKEPANQVLDPVVGWEDIMPTFLVLGGASIPETVEGRSLVPLFSDKTAPWREFYHGEHSPEYHPSNANQFLTDGTWKYIWNSSTGEEQLFYLEEDPLECEDLVNKSEHQETLKCWRNRLIEHLKDREEGISDGEKLVPKPLPPNRGGRAKSNDFE